MDLLATILGWLSTIAGDYTLRTVTLGAALLGGVSGALGTFAVLRRQSLMGDAVSHAALPGIALAFMITGTKAPLVLLGGAALAGWLGMVAVGAVVRHSRVKIDSALGIVLSVFFGLGLVLLTYIQRSPQASQAGLETFLFGQASALVVADLIQMAVLGGLILLVLALLWKEMTLLSFDPAFGATLGLPMKRLDLILTSLLVVAIVMGLQTVGVVLMSAMVVAPAAAARQWSDRVGVVVFLAGGFGALAGGSGALASSAATRVPTGPAIVVAMSLLVALSLLFAPRRGLLATRIARSLTRRRLVSERVLCDLYELSLQHGDRRHPHGLPALAAMTEEPGAVRGTLRALESVGRARLLDDGRWALTAEGVAEAERLLTERGVAP